MAQYLTYEQYHAWGGTLDESAFNLAEIKARARIDALTMGRVKAMAAVPEQVQAAMMEIITVDGTYSASVQASAPVVASFTTDGYSESYQGAGERALAANRALDGEIRAMLAGETDAGGTPLTYAGVSCL